MTLGAVLVCVACGSEPSGSAGSSSSGGAGSVGGAEPSGGAGGAAGGGVEALADGSFLCRPPGAGPFACALYNHGGKGTAIGGDLEGTCAALADAGMLARSEKRPETVSLAGHLDDVLAALDLLRADPACDPERMGVIGFSRGGLLTLQAALARPDDVAAVVLLAPASGNGALEDALQDVAPLGAPASIHVAENDLYQDDHVALAQQVHDTLAAAGKEVDLTVQPPFGDDGHALFFEVREPYWSEVLAFLADSLR